MMYSNYYFDLPQVCQPKSRQMARQLQHSFRPKMNVRQNDEQIMLEFALAGVLKEDVKMDIKNHVLSLEAQRKTVQDEKSYQYREYGPVNFKTKIQLPDDIDEESIEAQFENGVLEINIRKEKKKIVQIEIK